MSDGRSSWEPRRWSDATSDAPEELRAALQDARDTTLSAADSERVATLAERLGVGGGVTTGVALSNLPGVGSAGVGAGSAAVAYKLWAYLSGVVAVSAVALVVWTNLGPSAPPDAHAVGAPRVVRDEVVGVVASPPSVALPPVLPVSAPEPVIASAEAVVTAAPSASRIASRRRPSSIVAAPVAAKLDAQAELTILHQAQDALPQTPRRALTLAEDHARDFPRGVFAQEREVIAIEALIKLQRSDQATARGRAFLSTYANSTHAPRVQRMLGQ